MESELSGIFRVKLVAKNIVHGSPGTQFMHIYIYIYLIFMHIFIYLIYIFKDTCMQII